MVGVNLCAHKMANQDIKTYISLQFPINYEAKECLLISVGKTIFC